MTGNTEGMATKHLWKALGYEVSLVNHVDSQPATVWTSTRGVSTDEACDVEVHVRARCRGEEANDSCLRQHEVEQSRLDDKVPCFFFLRRT